MSESRKMRANVTYQRGSGSVEMELSRVQSCLEDLHPQVISQDERIDRLESKNDKAETLIKVAIAVSSFTFALVLAFFTWALNHMSFRADFYELPRTSISPPSQSTVSTDSHPSKGQ